MSIFYEIDSTRVSFKEYWWWSQSPRVLVTWMLKCLRARIPCSSDDPTTDSTLPFVVEQLPPDIASTLAPLEVELTALGFHDPVFHVIHDPGTRTTIYWATYRHESEKYFARIHHRVWQVPAKTSRALFPMFFTEFADGTFLVSSSGKPDMDAPARVGMNRMPRAQCDALWQKHLALSEAQELQKNIVPIRSQADLIAATERHHVLTRDFHLARRVFRVRTADEQARAERYAAAVEQGRLTGVKHPEIIAELEKLQETKPAWRGTFWVLAASVVLFIAFGAANWSWRFTLWLIPALLLHEGGHWITMRIFKYRNLRMFFIPLFGAAVTGRNWNVAGWKKALVSLAGPLPGIALGLVLGIAGMITHTSSLIEAALILVLLNGLNLLPILPFDGGHFMQAVLFCRNRWLDIAFRVMAIAGLFALSVFGLGRIFIYLAIVMAIYLPVAFKLGTITDLLRKANLPPPLPGEDHIPLATAETIVDEVKTALPKNLSNKAAAQHALNVFESLNAHPPGILSTTGLLGLYGGGLAVAVLACMLFFVAREGRFSDFLRTAARQPRHAVTCGSVQSWQGATATAETLSSRNTLVTTLKNASAAKSTFTSLTGRLPQSSQLTLFGDSLVLTLPCSDDAAREQWFNDLQTVSSNTFVAISNEPIAFDLTFIAPTASEATNLERTIANYLNAPGAHLIPPWSRAASGPQFQAYEQARWQWRQMDVHFTSVWTNAELNSFLKQIAAARQRGAVNEANTLDQARTKRINELRDLERDRLRKDPAFDSELVDLKCELSSLNYTNQSARADILRRVAIKMGQESTNATDMATLNEDARGIAHRSGLLIRVAYLTMDAPSTGLPALVDWLCSKNCKAVHYQFYGVSDGM